MTGYAQLPDGLQPGDLVNLIDDQGRPVGVYRVLGTDDDQQYVLQPIEEAQ